MAKSDIEVSALVDKISRGEIQLPEMQRKYVWTSTKVRDLLDSLYRGYPSGVILTWQPPAHVETQDFAVDTTRSSTGAPPWLLLDGQQRLTSLSAVLRGEPVVVKNRKKKVEILFNLDHPEELTFITEVDEGTDDTEEGDSGEDTEMDPLARVNRRTFVVASNAVLALPNWVKVTDVFTKSDGELLRAAGVQSFDDPNYERYSERLKRLRAVREYEYRVDTLEPSKSYEEVTEIFVRVNSLGAKLRSSDLALAQITARWPGSLQQFNDFQETIAQEGFDLDLGIHLKALVAIITGQSRFLTVGSLSRGQLEDGWKETKRAMHFAANHAKGNLGIDSPALLASPFLMVALAYWGYVHDYKITSEQEAEFRRWFLVANAKGRYSRGSSETFLDQDIAAMRSEKDLLQGLVQQVGRLDVTIDDLVGRTARSGLFKTMFLMFRADKASDWASNLQISPRLSGVSDKIEFHHIFPKAYLKRVRPDVDRRLIDDIANLAFIGAQTNKQIRDRAPRLYRVDYEPARLEAQLVYLDGMDDGDQFEEFIKHRRQALARKINEYLGVAHEGMTSG